MVPGPSLDVGAVARIARWEVETAAGTLDRRVVIGAVGALVLTAAIGFVAVQSGVAIDSGLYRVGVGPDHPLHGPVADDDTFTIREPDPAALASGDLDVLLNESGVYNAATPKGRAALDALRESTTRYNDRLMATERNETAAFPVAVQVLYRDRTTAPLAPGTGDEAGPADDPEAASPTDTGGPDGGGTGPDGGAEEATTPTPTATSGGTDAANDGPIGVPAVGSGALFSGQSEGSPSDITPPFPFEPLVLAFLFVVPMNFAIQAYGTSILEERLDRRGEPMLVAPVSSADIVAGKTIPYLSAMLVVAAGIAALVGGGVLSVVAVLPLAVLFLAATFVGAMFARSFKELTFVTVAVGTGLMTYAFVPAIFASVGSVALISPLTLVVWDLQGEWPSLIEFGFATVPLTATAVVLFALGIGVYREEDMFTQRPLTAKALGALARHARSPRSAALVVALSIPFVFAAELLVVALLFAIPVRLSVPLLLVAIAVVEEVAKSLPAYAGFSHGRMPATGSVALLVGLACGTAFFVAEKGMLVVQYVGLADLTHGELAFAPAGSLPLPAPILFALPLALHTVTAVVAVSGARRGSARPYWLALVAAIALHVAYNLALLEVVGGV